MPKIKTNSSAKKRIKISAGGKLTQDQPIADADRREAQRLLGLK